MKILYIKSIDTYVPDCYPHERSKTGTRVKSFIYGKGWKTYAFKEVPDVELPEKWSKLSWLEIAILNDKYGIEVADCFAGRKTAGIVSRQRANSKMVLYQKIKELFEVKSIIDNKEDDPKSYQKLETFFDMLNTDYTLGVFGLFLFDIVALDKAFEKYETRKINFLWDDGSSGWWDHDPKGTSAWRLKETDDWNYDMEALPAFKLYNSIAATYKGEPCSMKQYVQEQWGDTYIKIIDTLNEAEEITEHKDECIA